MLSPPSAPRFLAPLPHHHPGGCSSQPSFVGPQQRLLGVTTVRGGDDHQRGRRPPGTRRAGQGCSTSWSLEVAHLLECPHVPSSLPGCVSAPRGPGVQRNTLPGRAASSASQPHQRNRGPRCQAPPHPHQGADAQPTAAPRPHASPTPVWAQCWQGCSPSPHHQGPAEVTTGLQAASPLALQSLAVVMAAVY